MKSKATKYLIGFGIFLLYYVGARILENKIAVFRKVTSIGATQSSQD